MEEQQPKKQSISLPRVTGLPITSRCIHTIGIVTMQVNHAGKGGQKVLSATAPLDPDYLRFLFEKTQTAVEKEQTDSDIATLVGLQNGYATKKGNDARKYYEDKKTKKPKDKDAISEGGIILPT